MADAVVMHIASRLRDDVPVVFLDTGYHFAETLGMSDAVEAIYPVKLHRMLPLLTVAEQDAEYGEKLHDRDPDACCKMRKVEPLERGLSGFAAWASGIRRDEGPTRADAGLVEWDAKRSMVKVNPIAAWTEADVDAYILRHGVLVNPLLTDGYSSVGCAPCTRRTLDGEDAPRRPLVRPEQDRVRSSCLMTVCRLSRPSRLTAGLHVRDCPKLAAMISGAVLTQRRHVDLKMVASAICPAG